MLHGRRRVPASSLPPRTNNTTLIGHSLSLSLFSTSCSSFFSLPDTEEGIGSGFHASVTKKNPALPTLGTFAVVFPKRFRQEYFKIETALLISRASQKSRCFRPFSLHFRCWRARAPRTGSRAKLSTDLSSYGWRTPVRKFGVRLLIATTKYGKTLLGKRIKHMLHSPRS